MKLILAEKPSLAKEIAFSILENPTKNKSGFWQGEDIIVAHLVGHVLEYVFPKEKWTIDNLPLNLDLNNLAPKKDKKSLVKTLVYTINSNNITEIISAGDADQEGSLLIYEILLYAGVFQTNKKLTRMWILAMDKKTIQKAFQNRFDYKKDKPFILAGQTRTYADAYVGINLTQLFTLKFSPKGILSVGRVQTPTLQLVRKREKEIENFVPRDYATIKGVFDERIEGEYFYLFEKKKATQIFDTGQLAKVENTLTDKSFLVKDKMIIEKKTKPDYLPNLNDILKNISKRYKIKAKKITADIQVLYENKLISYPRSESKFLPTSMAKDIQNILNQLSGNHSVIFNTGNKRIFDDSKVEAHFAIIPLKPIENEQLTEDQKKIFTYIKDKFIMAFMADYIYEQTNIILENSHGTTFEIKGRKEKKKGFRAYPSNLNTPIEDVILPEIIKGNTLNLTDYKIKKDTTKPPKLLTEAELLAQMENIFTIYKKEYEETHLNALQDKFSLGTPATRGGIIETLFKREYMTSDNKGYLTTTEKGRSLLTIVKNNIGIQLTAEFENKLEKIRNAKYNNIAFKTEIKQFTDTLIQQYKEHPDIEKPTSDVVPTGENCPECGSPLVRRKGKYGFFTSCSNYPQCKYIKKELPAEIKEGEVIKFSKGYKTVKNEQEYIIWRNSFGGTISQTDAKKLFSGQQVELSNLKNKAGKIYKAKAEFNFEKNKLELIFNKK